MARGEFLHLMQMPLVVGDPRQLRVTERPDQAGNLPADLAQFRLVLPGQVPPHRSRQRLQIAPGDLILVLPVQPAGCMAALAAMPQLAQANAQLL